MHADTILAECALKELEDKLENGTQWGGFHLHYATSHPAMKLLAWGANMRVRLKHIVYGDQGLFVTKKLYKKIGGFKKIALCEDLDISLRLKQHTAPVLLLSSITTSPKRHFEKGILKQWWLNRKIPHLFKKGVSSIELKKMYS